MIYHRGMIAFISAYLAFGALCVTLAFLFWLALQPIFWLGAWADRKKAELLRDHPELANPS